MNRVRRCFPVIHCASEVQVRSQVDIVLGSGGDGVFLIDQGGMWEDEMIEVAHVLKREHGPQFFVGVNRLGARLRDACKGLGGLDGVWTDNAGICDGVEGEVCERVEGGPSYFGGVAFKGQRQPRDLEGTVRLASRYMDVVCTSGPGTGVAASVEKVRRMREALGEEGLLALASGVATQPDNVDGYLPYVDFYLVATGISKDFLTFDPAKVRDLLDRIRG